MIDVNGVLTYWGPVTINNEKYYMFIVDNEDSYTAGEITKLAEIIELATACGNTHRNVMRKRNSSKPHARQQEPGIHPQG